MIIPGRLPQRSVLTSGDLLEERQWRLHSGPSTGTRGLPHWQHVPWTDFREVSS